MVFNSITFLIFFLLFFPSYWLLNKRVSGRAVNLFTLIASYLFYGWWDWRFLGLIFISSLADFIIGLLIAGDGKYRKALLILSIFINLGILCFFKYFNFFIDSITAVLSVFPLHLNLKTLSVILPVGISFYTFQTLSYTIDIYRRKIDPVRDPVAFFTFVAFFPQLVAGPIERAASLLPQFISKRQFSYDKCVAGLRLALWGLFKKIVIADNFGLLADRLFDLNLQASGPSTILASVFFALQIYTDFSGYSDIAIGISGMLGIDLMKNFATPYFSGSLREFWRRWHISLSTWFRDYVYIPLGGNRVSHLRMEFNLFITFVLSGLWHGAQITFVIWGALHGLFLIVERKIGFRAGRAVTIPLVFFIVSLLWLPFRAENFDHLTRLAASLVHTSSYSLLNIQHVIAGFSSVKFISLTAILAGFLLTEWTMATTDFNLWVSRKRPFFRMVFYYILLLAILFMGNFDVKPYFIYFQF